MRRRSNGRRRSKLGRSYLTVELKGLVMRATVTSLLALCLCSGCGVIMVGDPVKKEDLSLQNDAEENLKAIRAMLDDQATRRAQEEKAPRPASHSMPSEATSSLMQSPSGARPVPSPSSSVGQTDAAARLPWTPTAPDRPAVPDRPVPAYTTPAPVGPDYSGSIRCAPDGMGGQRCAGR
jgi:hypothetical protein